MEKVEVKAKENQNSVCVIKKVAKEAGILLWSENWEVRKFAVKHATKEEVLEVAVSERYSDVVESIIERLKKEEITQEEANNLLGAESCKIRDYAVKYATKEKVLEVAVSEKDYFVVRSIIERLEKEEITEEQANTLFGSESHGIMRIAVECASKGKVLEVAVSKKGYDVAESIFERLEKEEITQEEADTLLDAQYCIIRNYAVEDASKEKVLKVAVSEKNDDVAESIIERLEKEEITQEEADTLLSSKSCVIRVFAVGYASKEKLLEAAVSEEDDDVAESIIERLEKEEITEEDANNLLGAESWIIRNYVVEYAGKEKVIEAAASEDDDDVAETIMESLEKEEITEEQANTFLGAESYVIRKFAVEYSIKEKVLRVAMSEESYDVTKSIIERLEKEKITEEEANNLLTAKCFIIRNFAVKYASKEKVLRVAMSEENDNLAESIIKRLKEEKITQEEANTLLGAKHCIIRNYAVKYATKEKILDLAMSKKCSDVAESIIERLMNDRITKEEVKKLARSHNDFIRNIANTIFRRF